MAKLTLKTKNGDKYQINDSDEIHRGGEGRIMAIAAHPNLVAKLYHDGITPISEIQFQYLSKLDPDLFVVPVDLLYNPKNEIVGFTMQYLGKDYFPLSSLFSKSFCLKNGITPEIKQEIMEKLILAVEYAHKNQVIIGDLNQYNVLVTAKADIRLIDTDSYETPNHKHTGMLLEDIRDYLKGGKVNAESDFFALSVNLFYSLTYTHPFKGIHKVHKSLAERMMSRTPIFCGDPELIIPKCYEPVSDTGLLNQFTELYVEGRRFLINIKGISQPVVQKVQPQILQVIIRDNLIITPVLVNANILDIYFNMEIGYIETDTQFLIYKSHAKGNLGTIQSLNKSEWQRVFLSHQSIFGVKNNSLYHIKSAADIVEITNFKFTDDAIVSQFGDILIVVGNDVMYHVYLNQIINTSVQLKRTDVFARGFRKLNGLIQNTGGIYRIFYNTGKDCAIVKMDKIPREVYQQENIGIVQYVENGAVKNQYFKIKGLQTEFAAATTDRVFDFAFMPQQNGEGIVFEPSAGKIKLLRTQDFTEISAMECDLITEQTKMQYCKAGIIAWESGSVYLLNKK